eukprot:1566929-Lingulodinium_polyedra.AAC.1
MAWSNARLAVSTRRNAPRAIARAMSARKTGASMVRARGVLRRVDAASRAFDRIVAQRLKNVA